MTSPSVDPAAFRDFEHAGWADPRLADRYRHWFAGLTTQVVPALLDAAGVAPGVRVLDVACGPGFVAGAAAERGAAVTGIDFSAAMVEAAKRSYPAVTFEEGDAEALAFPDSSFEAVLINFGILHLGRPDTALTEAFRVLRPGGRLAFTVWAPPDQAVGFGIPLKAVEEQGNPNVPVPPGPPFYRFADPAESRRTLESLGFTGVEVRTVAQTWHLPAPDAMMTALAEGGVRAGGLLRSQTREAQARIRQAVIQAAAAYFDKGAYHVPMPCVLSAATRP